MDWLEAQMVMSLGHGAMPSPSKPVGSSWDEFRFEVVVDWIELEFELSARTHFRHVKEALSVPYAQALEQGPGATATHFRVKFHDVNRYAMLIAAVRELRHRWGLAGPVKVYAYELAADLYPRIPQGEADKPSLAALGATWYQCMDSVIRDNHRLYRTKRDGVNFDIPTDIPTLAAQLLDGWQVGMGHRDAPVYQHLYVKTTDQNGQPIAPDRYRTRLELRISGEEGWRYFGWPGVPLLTEFEELQTSRKLNKHFYRRIDAGRYDRRTQFELPTLPQPLRRWDMQRLKGGGVKAYPWGSKADAVFNKRLNAAFRLLRSAWKRPY